MHNDSANREPCDLHSHLALYVEDVGNGLLALRHPLLYCIPYAPAYNAILNKTFESKKDRIASALSNSDWMTYIHMHEKPYRISAFQDIEEQVSDADYWKLMSGIWTGSENIYENIDDWCDLWSSGRSWREDNVMAPTDRAFLDSLPDSIEIYRGSDGEEGVQGLSWTLNRERALRFAMRFSYNEPVLAALTVHKSYIVAYYSSRGEDEVVIHPGLLGSVLANAVISYI